MAIAVPPVATMMMVPEAQCAVDSPNAGADRAAHDSSYRTRSSITSMGAFLSAPDQALSLRNHGARDRSEKSKSNSKTEFHNFSTG